MDFLIRILATVLPYAQWGLILYLVFAVWVVQRINERMRESADRKAARQALASGAAPADGGQRRGTHWFISCVIFVMFTFLSMGAALMPVAIGARIAVFFTGESHVATVVSVSSAQERVTRTDSDNRSYTTEVTMYTPFYAFTLNDGTQKETRGDVKSQDEPSVGDTQRIFFDTRMNQLVTMSISNVLMLSMGAVFSVVLLVLFGATLVYVFGGNAGGALKLMAKVLFRGVLPLAVAAMAAGIGYYLYERIATDRRDGDPVFLGVFGGFFLLMVAVLVLGWIRGRSGREAGGSVGTGAGGSD